MRRRGAEAFNRNNRLGPDGRDRHDAGSSRLTAQVHRARAALRDAAAELGAGETQVVAQDPEEGRVRGGLDGPAPAIYDERIRGHGQSLSREELRETWRTGRNDASSSHMTTYLRRLGLFSGTMAVVRGIIGGRIFLTPATPARPVRLPRIVPIGLA